MTHGLKAQTSGVPCVVSFQRNPQEGNHCEAIRTLRELSAADLRQTTEAALLLADAYEARKQQLPAQEGLGMRKVEITGPKLGFRPLKWDREHVFGQPWVCQRDFGPQSSHCGFPVDSLEGMWKGDVQDPLVWGSRDTPKTAARPPVPRRSPGPIETGSQEIFQETQRALAFASPEAKKKKVKGSVGGSTFNPEKSEELSVLSSKQVLAQCSIATRQLRSELLRLTKSQSSKEWLQDMQMAFDRHLHIGQELLAASFHRRHVAECLEFLELMCPLLECREMDLTRDPQNSAASYEKLEEYVTRSVAAISAVRSSCDALLSSLPVEGVEQEAALPAEILVARLEVWEARILALRRGFAANAKNHRRLQRQRMKFMQDPRNPPLFAVGRNEGGKFGGLLTTHGSHSARATSSIVDDQDRVERWLKLVDEQITEEEKMSNYARDMSEVEDSLAKAGHCILRPRLCPAFCQVSNAVSLLELADTASALRVLW